MLKFPNRLRFPMPLVMAWVFISAEAWMLEPILRRHPWVYGIWIPYALAVGFFGARVDIKARKRRRQ